jgi:SAM-dependent methyltransferase
MTDQASQGLLSPFLQRARLRAALPFVSGDTLDIGCGNGALAAFLPPERYYGYDPSRDVVAVAVNRFPRHKFSCSLPASGTFETITALAVIEHINNPVEALYVWRLHLKEKGRIVLTTPHRSYAFIHEAGSSIGIFSHAAAEEHHTMFDRAAIEKLACLAGLRLDVYRRFLAGANQLCILTA